MATPKKGSTVTWNYGTGTGTGTGTVTRVSTGRIEIKSGDATIVRNGSKENPAVVIKQVGKTNRIVKLSSELKGGK
jgi:lipopolysaccharide export system protein LptA